MEISKLLIPNVDTNASTKALPRGQVLRQDHEDEFEECEADISWTERSEVHPCSTRLAAALKTIPKSRQLAFRKGRETMNLRRKESHQAALGQTRGKLARVACANCLKENGPFAECVVVAGCFAGACCNCHFNARGPRCSLWRSGHCSNTTQPNAPRPNHPKPLIQLAPPPESVKGYPIPHSRQHTAAQNPAKDHESSLLPANINLTGDYSEEPNMKRQRLSDTMDPSTASTSLWPSPRSTPVFPSWHTNTQHRRAGTQYLGMQYQRVRERNEQLELQNQGLVSELESFRREKLELSRLIQDEYLKKMSVIKNVVVSNAIIEAAVDAREAQMRVGLSLLGGNEAQVKEQAMQLLNFSNNTTFLISRLVVGAMQEHQAFITDEEHSFMQSQFDNATPNAEVAAIIDEKLEFTSREGQEQQGIDSAEHS